MATAHTIGRGARWLAGTTAVLAAGWVGCAAFNWSRYGRVKPAIAQESDPILDAFMPEYDIVERHHITVAAPAAITLAAASDMDPTDAPLVSGIFKARELLLGSTPDDIVRPKGVLALTKSIGWGELAQVPGREIVMGAATKPWDANPVFHPIAPAYFAGFDEPGYVKIVWTLRADPISPTESIFRTETRAVATDAAARARFRTYWSWLSPGIVLIRRAMLGPVKAEAERRARFAPAA